MKKKTELVSQHSERLQKRNKKKYEFHIQVHNEESTTLEQNPPLELNSHNTSPNPNDDNDDTDYYSDGTPSISPSSYLQSCLRMNTSNLVQNAMHQFASQGMLHHFIAFLQGLSDENVQANNISIQLAMEYSLLQSLNNSTQMRYRHSTCQFWESVLAIRGPRLLRFFSSDKHFGQVNSGVSEKGKYKPISGSYNFAVPDECLLQKSTTDIPNKVKCGIIELCFTLFSTDKQYILSLDGKQSGQGLRDGSEGDVNLWGI